ncbi:3-deoxy-manno-octulosonate cytidylyltransferase [Fluviicola taffensis]|nr:3-deoxy-manno-octulosonate cytidylyltransferase [Fluviicola taffensis]
MKEKIMRILGIIPARYGSSRFPGKPLIDLKGKTMIQRVVEGAAKSSLLTDLIVATDDQRIVEAVESFGGKVQMTDSKHPTGTDRCAEIVRSLADNYDVVINIQGDEPLVDARQLDQLLQAFTNPEVQIATLASRKIEMEDILNPNRIKVIVDKNQNALYFSRSPIPNFANAKGEPLEIYPFLRHIGLYAYRSEVLLQLSELEETHLEKIESLEQLRWLYNGYKIQVVETEIETPNIDTPEDVEKVLNLL